MRDGKNVWRRPGYEYLLPDDEVHVWRASLDCPPEYIARLRQTLSFDESERADKFRFSIDRTRFIVGRGLSRTLLGHCLAIAPGSVGLDYGIMGKPCLAAN